jgi:hypothetical protein
MHACWGLQNMVDMVAQQLRLEQGKVCYQFQVLHVLALVLLHAEACTAST